MPPRGSYKLGIFKERFEIVLPEMCSLKAWGLTSARVVNATSDKNFLYNA